jgi:tRNA1(Val) A37 N6-methylase TrmN6
MGQRYYRIEDDWLTHLEGDIRPATLAILRGLSLERLQKIPPPKIGGLPFGNETRVLGRYLKNRSSQLDPSALSNLYRSFATKKDQLIYRGFRENAELTREEWAELIYAENVDKWIENKFLRATANGLLVCQFTILVLDGLIFLIDPLSDHGPDEVTLALKKDEYSEEDIGVSVHPYHHTYMGQDSLQMIEMMERSGLPEGGRYLDCGPGAGGLLLYFSRLYDEAVGIDINHRAATLANINAELNGLTNVKAYHDDALNLGGRYGKFDLVSWNLPFLYLPDELEDRSIDAFGGEMGIGLCLQFVDIVPDLLTERGLTVVAAMSPVMKTGENVLEQRLKGRLETLGLDCTIRMAQVSFARRRDIWDFHQRAGIRKFEAVYLYLSPGTGKMKRIETSPVRKGIDLFREKMYQRKFS